MQVLTLIVVLIGQVAILFPIVTASLILDSQKGTAYGLYVGAVAVFVLLAICLKLMDKISDLQQKHSKGDDRVGP